VRCWQKKKSKKLGGCDARNSLFKVEPKNVEGDLIKPEEYRMSKLSTRKQFLLSFIAIAAVLTCLSQGSIAFAKGGVKPGETRVEGTLISVNPPARQVQIRTNASTVVVVNLTPSTKIERNGLHVRLTALKLGDRAQARISNTTQRATKLESRGA
jgi:hypothetical protein